MADRTFSNVRIKHKRDTSANWTTNNPVLLEGEIIIVDTNDSGTRLKVGDGTKTYTQLPFIDELLYNALNNKQPSVLRATITISVEDDSFRVYVPSSILEAVDSTESLLVYHNGLLLEPYDHYLPMSSSILMDYEVSTGDIVTFVAMK